MDRLLKWMRLVFDESTPSSEPLSPRSETQREYKKELFNIYVTIHTDYKEYQKMKKYNQSIWILSSYRSKDTKTLSKKILSDITLFKEGLQMYSMFEKL
jgi:subtilase family serine protease